MSWSERAEQQYRSLIDDQARAACRRIVLLAFALFPAFTLLDFLTQRDAYRELSVIRFSTTALYGVAFFAMRRGKFLARPFITSLVVAIVASLSISTMCVVLTGYQSRYYAGVNLVVLASVLLFPWNARRMAIVVGAALGIYVVMVLVAARFVIERPDLLINNLYFLFATGIIGVASAHLTEQLRRESFRRYIELEQAQADLSRKGEALTMRDEFISIASHELRTPLTSLKLQTELVRRKLASSDFQNQAQAVQKLVEGNDAQLARLVRLVDDMLDVSRMSAGRLESKARRRRRSGFAAL
jgi:signal transduction histidine kinase